MNPKVLEKVFKFAKFNAYCGRYVWNGGAGRLLIQRTFNINNYKEACRYRWSQQSRFPGIEQASFAERTNSYLSIFFKQ